MTLQVEDRGSIMVIQVQEERIDAAGAIAFKDKMRDATASDHTRVILDLSNVRFLDSSGLGAVVASIKAVGNARKMELAALTPAVEKVFQLTRLNTVFKIHASVEDALTKNAAAR